MVTNKFLQLCTVLWLVIFLVSCVVTTPTPPNACDVTPAAEYANYSLDRFVKRENTKYIFVLVDAPGSSTGEIDQITSFIQDNIVSNLSPGDRLVMAWVESEKTMQESLFLDEYVEPIAVSLEMMPPTPTPPIIRPAPTRGGSTTQKNMQDIDATRISNENAFLQEQYHCETGKWNKESSEIYDSWEQQQQDTLNKISEKIREKIEGKLTSPAAGLARDIYGGFEVASSLVRSVQQGDFSEYTLLLLSSMEDAGNTSPENIDLHNFDKLIVTAEECGLNYPCSVRTDWENRLQLLGVTPLFRSRAETPSAIAESNLDCNPDSVDDVSFAPNSTEYVMVLIDKTRVHEPYLPEAINLITNTIATNLEPGDHLAVSWLDLSATPGESMFLNRRVPIIPPPPDPPLDPFPTPCKLVQWKKTRQAQYEDWVKRQRKKVEETATAIIDLMGTPSPSKGKLLYESLKLMSRAVQESQKADENFKRYTLFIFASDLSYHERRDHTDWGVDNMEIDLTDVNVYIIDLSCDNHLNCTEDEYWIEEIGYFNPQTVQYLIPVTENHISDFLLDYMTQYHNP